MPLIVLVLVLVAIGVVMWLVNTYIPMQAGIKKALNIAVLVAVILYLLKVFGLFQYLSTVTI